MTIKTGAGKTYTMTGDRASFARRGLIPRVVSGVFAALRGDAGLAAWRMRVTYLEVRLCLCVGGGVVTEEQRGDGRASL